jgi:hypothetical protein
LIAEFQGMSEQHPHGPDNAEFEIRKAYNCVVESATTYRGEGVEPREVVDLYKKSFRCYREGDRLSAERWARTTKHLARALWHEAKISYLEAHPTDLPFLEGAREEYNLHEHVDTTIDLLNSVAGHIPPGFEVMPREMSHYIARAREHLKVIESPDYRHELLRAERIKAAHEYGRVLECSALAYEAEDQSKAA